MAKIKEPSSAMPTLERDRFLNFTLTRTTACLLSLFGPVLLVVPFMLLVVLVSTLDVGAPNETLIIIGAIVLVVAVVAMRIYFARWYVRDKGRNPNWGAVAAIGLWGWVVLWLLADFNKPAATTGPTTVA